MDLEAERARTRKSRAISIVLAVLLHIGFVLSIPAVRETIGFEIESEGELVEEPPPPPTPPPAPEPPPVVEPVRQPRAARTDPPPDAPPPVNEPPPPPAAPPPLDFGDMVVTNSTSGDSIPTDGQPGGVRGGVRGGQPGGVVGGSPDGVVGGTGPITRANLSRRPRAPSGLNDAALRRNYPLGARRTGTPGEASVRITLGPDGRIQSVATGRESPSGFGFADACKRTVLEYDSGWQPALDSAGNPGSFTFPFPCTFEINQ